MEITSLRVQSRHSLYAGTLTPPFPLQWYTSDEVKIEDCESFDATGECEQRSFVGEEESDAGGLCDDCTREHDEN